MRKFINIIKGAYSQIFNNDDIVMGQKIIAAVMTTIILPPTLIVVFIKGFIDGFVRRFKEVRVR